MSVFERRLIRWAKTKYPELADQPIEGAVFEVSVFSEYSCSCCGPSHEALEVDITLHGDVKPRSKNIKFGNIWGEGGPGGYASMQQLLEEIVSS